MRYKWTKRAADKVMPYIPNCVVCGIEKGVENSLCKRCGAKLNELKHGSTKAKELDAFSVYKYEGAAAKLVKGYKYNGKRYLSEFMADEMAKAIVGEFSAICHVPLHKKRLRQRGFDQAELLAKGIAQRTRIPFINLIERVRNTKMQTKLGEKQRRENMKGAFIGTRQISGNVVLIDDVLTTGATALECAEVLTNAGASSVFVLTFARSTGSAPAKKMWFARK